MPRISTTVSDFKLSREQAKALSQAILAYPEGCEEGKKAFLEQHGLPIVEPSPFVEIELFLKVPLDHGDVRGGSNKLTAATVEWLLDNLPNLVPEGWSLAGLGDLGRYRPNEARQYLEALYANESVRDEDM